MARTVSVFGFTIGMVLAWGFPVMPVAAESGFVWGTAVLIETDDAGAASSPQVAIDPQGNAIAVWQQSDGTRRNIWANRFVPGVGWGTAVLIEADDAGSARWPQIAVDPQGNAIAVWQQWDGTRTNIWANRFVSSVGWGSAEPLEIDHSSARKPQIATDPQGNAIAVWSQSDSIWANRFVPDVGWDRRTGLLETKAGLAALPQVAIDPQANAIAVWQQSDFTRFNIWANRFVPDVGWGTPRLIEADDAGSAFSPQVAVDPPGNAIVVWHQEDGMRTSSIRATRFVPDIGWGLSELLETNDAGPARWPQVAVDPKGNAIAVWHQWDGTRRSIWANRFDSSVGWGSAELLDNSRSEASNPQIAIDPEGNAIAVWHQQNDANGYDIWANRFVPDVGWGTAELVETDDAGRAIWPQIAVDAQGNAAVVWSQTYSLNHSARADIWANRFAVDILPLDRVISPLVIAAAVTAGVAYLLWRRPAGEKEKA